MVTGPPNQPYRVQTRVRGTDGDPKLLSCPFCGGRAGFVQEDVGKRGIIYTWHVLCGGSCPEALFARASGATKREAAALWNHRVPAGRK